MKKIAVITHDSLNPIVGGGALRTLKVAQALKKIGYFVKLFVPSRTKFIDDMMVFSLPAPRKVRSQVLSAIKFNFRLTARLFKYAIDVNLIFIHNTIAMPATLLFAWIFKKKIVLDITDIHAEYLKIGKINILEKLARPIMLWFEYFMINRASKVIVVTKAMKEQIIRNGCLKNKISVVYDGADLSRFKAEKDREALFNIIHLGTVDKQHGVHYIALAAEEVINKYPNIHFYIVGDGRELKKVLNIVRKKNLMGYFTFTGYQNHFEIEKYLRKCAIGIIPRPKSLPNEIVITLKLPEYWASGTAVIASRLRGIEEIAKDGENIIFFEPDNYKDLAKKIIYIIENPNVLGKIVKGGLDSIKNFNWEILVNEIINILLRC